MATKQDYETGARVLAGRIKESQDPIARARIMNYLGNLRYAEYKHTENKDARRLAGNCYIAARFLNLKATTARTTA